jgi:class I fructose-bisphosphate aldolase
VPVVIAGGEKVDTDEALLGMVEGSLAAGGAGVSIGRNAFQHRDPERMVGAIARMVHGGASPHEALAFLKGD